MTIAEVRQKCKAGLAQIPRHLLVLFALLAASFASFACGYLAARGSGQGSAAAPVVADLGAPSDASTTGQYVASENGTKYYLPSCPGAGRISAANKIWFTSEAAARAAGYSPAANCPGL